MIDKSGALNLIIELLLSQPLGILATESVDGIHTTLIPFAYDQFHESIIFCTSQDSSACQNIDYTNSVSLLVHSDTGCNCRGERCSVSVQGSAILLHGEEQECAQMQLLGTHHTLTRHLSSPSMQSFALHIHSFELVKNFKTVQRVSLLGS